MWLSFCACMACAVLFLVVPGYLVTRGLRADRYVSLMVSPMVGVSLYGVLSIILGMKGMTCSWQTLALPVALGGALLCAVGRMGARGPAAALSVSDELRERIGPHGARLSTIAAALVIALLTGAGLTFFVFVNSLVTPDAFVQTYDNAWHLTHIADFMGTGNYSSFEGGFYPSAWHGIAAMAGSAAHASVPIAENATNAAFTAVVYPLSCVMLLATLFPESRRRVLIGAAFCMSIAYFPWRIMLYGPMFPNMAAFVVMPSVVALFVRMARNASGLVQRLLPSLLFVMGGLALILLQPNAIFSCGVFLAPFCLSECRRRVSKARGAKAGIIAELLLLVLFVAVWLLLVYSPHLQAVVWYERGAGDNVIGSIKWTLALSFVIRRLHYLIGTFVIIAAIALLWDDERRWLTLSYLLAATLFVVADGVPGTMKNIIAGFWYADRWRLACMVCVFAVPLIATGADLVLWLVTWPLCRRQRRAEGEGDGAAKAGRIAGPLAHAVTVVLVAIMLAYNYYPFDFVVWAYRVYAFDTVRHNFVTSYDVEQYEWASLTSDEMAFLEKVSKTVPEGEVILNQPFDGSVFAYSIYGIDVYYRQYGMGLQEGDKELREQVDDIMRDKDLQQRTGELGIRYLMQLDQGNGKHGVNPKGSFADLGYLKEEWEGINAVRDDTPGFMVVLSEGDMRLYRIDAVA